MSITCKDCYYSDPKETNGSKIYCEYYKTYYYGTESCYHAKDRNDVGGCYITTIVHEVLDKKDDCDVLITLRMFRDNVLQKDEKYKKLLIQYDIVGPKIADCIGLDRDKQLCNILFTKVLEPISQDIKKKNYNKAVKNYKALTNDLIDYYQIKENDDIYKLENDYDMLKAGHGKVYYKTQKNS